MNEFTYTFTKDEINLIHLVLSNNIDYLIQDDSFDYKNQQDKELLEKWFTILDKIEAPMKKQKMLHQTTREYYTNPK